ncbi:MAG: bifunctional UDP-N-acetylglucosamine diphosphorylase/glucosamine-1-phosphate N-acetyltransferase GlmU [Pseudomonadota bacterium]
MTERRDIAIVVLAAGKGTRMRSARAKVLHQIAGQPMLHHALRAALSLSPAHVAVVVGHDGAAVADSAREVVPDALICAQAEQLGTGHAVRMAETALAGFDGQLIVLYGDTPFVGAETLARLAEAPGALTALGFETGDPGRYGRFLLEGDTLHGIVEAKDATPEQLAITTCNSGVMAGPARAMFEMLGRVTNENAQGEYYLTDLVALARADGLPTRAVLCDEAETLGINDRVQLAAAEARFQDTARLAAMRGGATLIAPDSVHFAWDTVLGQDVVVEPHVVFGPGVRVADRVTIRAFSHIERTVLAEGCAVGPFVRLRGGVRLDPRVQLGNFVELKNAHMAEGAKAAHLTYLGDAEIGAGTNIGAGTITCNYDGAMKHRTTIGEDVFIGTNTALVAPVTVGDGAYTATGTVVTRDVPAGDLAIARARQQNKTGFGTKLRERLAALKAAQKASKSAAE